MANTLILLVGRVGFEPTANGLKVRCSTAELTAHFGDNFEGVSLTASLCRVKKKPINMHQINLAGFAKMLMVYFG